MNWEPSQIYRGAGLVAFAGLALLTALSHENELAMHVRAAVGNGVTPAEIREVLGDAASRQNTLNVFMQTQLTPPSMAPPGPVSAPSCAAVSMPRASPLTMQKPSRANSTPSFFAVAWP